MKKIHNKNNIKFIFLSSVVMLFLFVLIYGVRTTYSSLMDSDKKNNDFKIGNLKGVIEEEFIPPESFEPDVEYEKQVWVKNDGDIEAFVRVLPSAEVYIEDEDGNKELLPSDTEGDDAVLTIDYNLNDWIDGKDGNFYYKKKIKKGEKTTKLFTTVKMNKENIDSDYDGAKLSIEVKSEIIFTTKYAYRESWWQGVIPEDNSPLKEVDEILSSQTIN